MSSLAPRVVGPAKVRAPDDRRAVVSRRDLISRLTTSGCPLVLVSAPVGYGKTTLLAEWAARDGRPVAWVSLDAHDNDPITMLQGVVHALAALGAGRESPEDHRSSGPAESALGQLSAAAVRAPQPFLVVLDDVHHITDERGLELLDGLVGEVPAGSQIAMAGRVEPPFVARRRVSGEVVEVGPRDLAFGELDSAAVFAAAGVTISAEDARQVVDRTEGWPAGVYLSALVTRDDPGSSTPVLPVKGSSRYVADYLVRSVFDGLADDVKEFLLGSCVLDEMSGPLCAHVLGEPHAQSLLERLERDNLFVVPLDDTREWFRYHALFREFLLSEFRRLRNDADLVDLQRRAAAWCEANDRAESAVEYLLRARDSEQLGPLLLRTMRSAYLQGRVSTVDRWLGATGPGLIEQSPSLAVFAAWIMALTGRAVDAERWAALSGGDAVDVAAGDGWSSFRASSAALRALMCADGVEAMHRDAQLVVDLEPNWSVWRTTSVWLLGQARELTGDRDGAIDCYDEVIRLDDDGTRRPILIAPVSRALMAMDAGDWTMAGTMLEKARRVARAFPPGNYLTAAIADAVTARLALRNGDLDLFEERRTEALHARHLGTYAVPHAAVRLRVVLADLHLATGDGATARQLLREIDELLAVRPGLGALLDDVARVRDLADATGVGGVALTHAELRVLTYLPTHLTFAQIGAELFVSRHTVHSHAGSIYRKFGVSSRSEAVARARELGFGHG